MRFWRLVACLSFLLVADTGLTATNLVSVERIFGPDAQVQRGGAGSKNTLKLSDLLQFNDVIYTGNNTSLILRLGDGSKINIGYSTEFRVLTQQTQLNLWQQSFQLVVGWVRALVATANVPNPNQPIKLKIYTPSGTLGVRGTEFSIEHDGIKDIVYVLSGTIYLGPPNASDKDLKAQMHKNETAVLSHGSVSGKTSFNSNSYPTTAKPKGYQPMSLSTASSNSAADMANISLLQAASLGNIADIKAAISAGADINTMDGSGKTPLMLALSSSSTSPTVIQKMLSLGAAVNIADYDGRTPLMIAIASGASDTVIISLINAGADLNTRTETGLTALDLARQYGRIVIAEYISSKLKSGTVATSGTSIKVHSTATGGGSATTNLAINNTTSTIKPADNTTSTVTAQLPPPPPTTTTSSSSTSIIGTVLNFVVGTAKTVFGPTKSSKDSTSKQR